MEVGRSAALFALRRLASGATTRGDGTQATQRRGVAATGGDRASPVQEFRRSMAFLSVLAGNSAGGRRPIFV